MDFCFALSNAYRAKQEQLNIYQNCAVGPPIMQIKCPHLWEKSLCVRLESILPLCLVPFFPSTVNMAEERRGSSP